MNKKDWEKTECCGTCFFGMNQESKVGKVEVSYQTLCRLNPVTIRKQSDDWCGKYEPKKKPKTTKSKETE